MAEDLTLEDLSLVRKETFQVRAKWYDVGLELGVHVDELDRIEKEKTETKDCHLEMLKSWLKRVELKPTWASLVIALESEVVGESALAQKLKELYCTKAKPHQQPEESVHQHRLISELRGLLQYLPKFQDAVNVQEALHKYVSSSILSGSSVEHVEEQLRKLCRDEMLISEELFQQACKQAHELHRAQTQSSAHVSLEAAKVDAVGPLFNKDTVYHAGICSLAVNTCDAGNYQQFFKNKEMVPGHSFTEVSLSRSKQDRYIIARQGDFTLYFGFQSEPQLLEWSKQFKSFSEGIAVQSEKFPIRFIVELLNTQHRIVLTGFSFGGLLACAVTACVWDTPYISTDLLKQNLICITFGQSYVSIAMLERVARQRPELVSTIHCFHCQDDPVPRLLRFLDESWSQKNTLEGKENKLKLPEHMRAPFQDPATSDIVSYIAKLQQLSAKIKISPEAHTKSVALLLKLKSKLKSAVAKLDPTSRSVNQLPQCTTSYLISTVPTELTCTRLSQEQAGLRSNFLQQTEIENLNSELFEQHLALEYVQKKLFHSYLEKEPKYTLPSAPKYAPVELADLKPSVKAVELCHHGNETAVVLEGEKFWFCHQTTVGGHSMSIPVQSVTASSIQFNIPREEITITVENGMTKVSLHSHFSKPIKEYITANVLEFNVTTRQEQLAQLTPSQLIELAYLCALLEQHPHSKSEPMSHKLEVIRSFLEKVVHVVPLESIIFAIANGSDDTTVSCSKALVDSQLAIPTSTLLSESLGEALYRIQYGIQGYDIKRLKRKSLEHLPPFLTFNLFQLQISSDEVSVSVVHDLPGHHPPASQPLSKATMKREEVEFKSLPAGSEAILEYLRKLHDESLAENEQPGKCTKLTCGLNIDALYPISHDTDQPESSSLKSPLAILSNGRKKLSTLLSKAKPTQESEVQTTLKYNQKMIETVNRIRRKEVAICSTLLGAFMEQEEIAIGLQHPQHAKSHYLAISATASVGVWALFSLDYSQLQPILAKCKGNELLVKIEDYIKALSGDPPKDSRYAAKLQFMVQGVMKTVTCNSQYISYSLERQLMDVCRERKINFSIDIDDLLKKWGGLFKNNTLSLVQEAYRPLIARWLKWALMVHNLREELAKYISIGVIGLVNSGKSKLVNTLFGIQIPVGTAEAKRTTVPFLYNLDEHVEGLDVVDFPGVDDEDDTIPDLADLLVTIAQIVIFVVDYRKVHTQSAKKWLERLQTEKVPVLVCLTFADKFYAEHMTEDRQSPKKETMKQLLEEQLAETRKKLGSSPSRKIQFFSFSQDRDSVLNSDEGRQKLKDVGIDSPQDVGEWLVEVFQRDFGQEILATQLKSFICSPSHK